MELLKIDDLCKTYGKGDNAVYALNHISFTIPKGQLTAIIGPSGSGKSTLMHMIGGVDHPTSGKIYLDGQDIYAQNNQNLAIFRRRQVGLIYQFYNLIPVLNVEENITLPMMLDGRTPDHKKLDKIIELMELSDRRTHLPAQLSGGQQQRVAIARALFSSPSVILADEPTGNLDNKNSKQIVELLKKTNRELNQTTLIITHNEEIALQCDRIISLSDGRIVNDRLINRPE